MRKNMKNRLRNERKEEKTYKNLIRVNENKRT